MTPASMSGFRLRRRLGGALVALFIAALTITVIGVRPATADSYVPVSGAGSTWSENALDQWISDVQQYGMRDQLRRHRVDGRAPVVPQRDRRLRGVRHPVPDQPDDGSAPENPTAGTYAYMPITAGGTVFMYNLTINGQRVTNLRLSGENIAKIFTGPSPTGTIPPSPPTTPGCKLPNEPIVPVVRSDGAGSTAQFSEWMISQYPSVWNSYCNTVGTGPGVRRHLVLSDGARA